MSDQAILRVLALLAILAEAGTVAILVALIFRQAEWSQRLRRELAPWALWAATAVATISMAGSLWFSESVGFIPCTLCWYQRIAMYPLVVLLGVAAMRRDPGSVRLPATILAGIGGGISILHLVEQWGPQIDLGVCSSTVPCSAKWVTEFGYLTIPAMALSGFVFILALLSISKEQQP
jgi:disulfide bond formation protein DsbB